MNINGTTLLAIVTAPLIIGSLLGAPYAAQKQKPKAADPAHKGTNLIRLEIDPAGEVVLSPQVGDTVEWYLQPTKGHPKATPVSVSFPSYTPCQGKVGETIAYCLVQKEGHFEYDCVPKDACADPGMDPRSQTGTVLLAMPAGTGGGTPAPAVATGPPPLPRITITCDNQYSSLGLEPIPVLKGQKIRWIDAPGQDFTIVTTPRKFCAEDDGTGPGIQSYNSLAVCTASAASGTSATYIVQGACPNSNKTFNISVK